MAFWLQLILAFSAVITSGSILFVIIKSGAYSGLKESNTILRGQVQDYKEEIVRLNNDHKEELTTLNGTHLQTVKELGELRGKFDQAQSEKSKLETLIIQSLDAFWKNNPKLALELQTKINPAEGKTGC
jgi:hypothetical protein